jgi:urea-proton symporter
MSNVQLSANGTLRPELGIASEILLGVLLLTLVYYVKVKLVRNTKDFVIANRKIGFGFGVAGLISIWTWAMAVMMSAAQTFSFGLSGLF